MRLRRFALVVAILAVVAALAAALPRPLFASREPPSGESRRILVLVNPIHTDIALPPDPDVLARFAFLRQEGFPVGNPAVGWLVFGWGGRSFYLQTPTWADLKPGPVLRAFTVDRSVMHVALAGPIPDDAPFALALDLSAGEFGRLLDALEGSFLRDGQGAPRLIEGAGYGAYDRFYEARGWFNAFVGCNAWTARVLRHAGLRTAWWNPLPQTLAWSLERYNGAD